MDNDKLLILNIHAEALPGHKLDTKKRIHFSETVLGFINQFDKIVMGGDFNLMPRTKSIKVFEENGFINLIKKFKINRTRNRYAWEQARNLAKKLGHKFYGKQRFADYCFVSKNIKVKNFEVPDIEISDHFP